jgi:Putative prokaryotic signal transducing protein
VSAGDFRLVAAYRDVIQAETAQELLQAAGIEARVLDRFTAGVDPLYAFAVGWVKVIVREADLIEARALLRALLFNLEYGLPSGRRAGPTRYGPRCRACGSPATVPAPGAARLGWLALWVFSLPLPLFGPRRRCLACGHVWRLSRSEREGPEEPLHPAFERAIAEYEAGLRRRLVTGLKRVAGHKVWQATLAAAATQAERRRRTLAIRYEEVRKAAVAAVAAGLHSEGDRELLTAQADLAWGEVVALEQRPDALTAPARRVLLLLATEARQRADLAE